MKKYIIFLFVVFSILFVSCDFPPTYNYIKLEIKGRNSNIYWQMIKDGEADSGEYQHYPISNKVLYDLEPGDGYTLKFYIVTSTIIDGDVEKRIIGDTYETYIVIDHWYTTICPTYTKEEGLGCIVEKSERIN